ncbi:MAG: hypothetical protein P8K08_19410 [Fuerstiella sp.]|jgi:hypothetical protein|nr:hypothetical protein [Fuerstiella sp.]
MCSGRGETLKRQTRLSGCEEASRLIWDGHNDKTGGRNGNLALNATQGN